MPEMSAKYESEESSLGGSPPASSSNLSIGSHSRCSSVSSHDGFAQLDRQSQTTNSISDLPSDKSQSEREFVSFKPAQYLKQHKMALAERAHFGATSRRMRCLYRYWMDFLQDNFNDAMFQSFVKLAQEDAAQGETHGLCCLFKYFKRALMTSFEAEHYVEFEQLAHRYLDYMDFDFGIRCLVELLTMGGQEAASAAGHTLAPVTIVLLEAWQAHVALANASMDPRQKLHKQLAEKRKSRSKARCNRSAKDDSGIVAAVGGEPAQGVPNAEAAPSSSVPNHQKIKDNRQAQGASSKTAHKGGPKALQKAFPRAKYYPQAQPQASLSQQARGLPDRLGDFLGN